MKDRRAEFMADLIMRVRILPGMVVRKLLPNGEVLRDQCYWVEQDRAQKHLVDNGRDRKTWWLAALLSAERDEKGYDSE